MSKIRFIRLVVGLISTGTLSSCLSGPSFFKQSNSATLSENSSNVDVPVQVNADGTLLASLNADSGDTQTIQVAGDSAIAGSAISFPPGSLAVNTDITLEEGGNLVSDNVAGDLGLGNSANGIESAGSALVISSSASIDALQPFTVSLNIDSGSGLLLNQADKQLVILYKVKKVDQDSGTFVGIIQNKDIERSGDKLSFKTKYFGSYQAVYISVDITNIADKPASTPIETKRVPSETTADGDSQDTAKAEVRDPESVEVIETKPNYIKLRWKQPTPLKEFRFSAVVSDPTGANASAVQCKSGQTSSTKYADAVTEYAVSGLNPYTAYTIRICAVGVNGTVTNGTVVFHKTLDLPPSNPTALTAAVKSSRGIGLNWSHAGLENFMVAWTLGETGGPNVIPPVDCKNAVHGMLVGNSHSAEIREFKADSAAAFRVCAVNRNGVYSSGATVLSRTESSALSCTSGTLDDTCRISEPVYPETGKIVAGMGNLVIEPTGTLEARAGERLEIDMKGKVETEYSIGSWGTITANGKGYAGGGSGQAGFGQGNVQGGNGSGKFLGASASGGAHGGEGGFEAQSYSTGDVPRAYDNIMFPNDFGAGGGGDGGAGGAGGGLISIRASKLINSGLITANGELGGNIDDGGGAGGSILIQVEKISAIRSNGSITGYIKTYGGNGDSLGGGGGGGGRIAIHYTSAADSSLVDMEIYTHGGTAACSGGKCDGAAGTLYVYDGADSTQKIYIKGIANPGLNAMAKTPINLTNNNGSKRFALLSVEHTAKIYFDPPIPADINLVNVTIGPTAAIDHSGRGYRGGYYSGGNIMAQGPNGTAGGQGTVASGGGGGGAAGAGGNGKQSTGIAGISGSANGDNVFAPIKPGAGGGKGGTNGSQGGSGGGALKLIISGTLTIDGAISSNGEAGHQDSAVCGGGGGGGALWLKALNLIVNSGASFQANGGSGIMGCSSGTGGGGGGGGGGSISIEATTVTGSLTCQVLGGGGNIIGINGTKKLKTGNTTTDCP